MKCLKSNLQELDYTYYDQAVVWKYLKVRELSLEDITPAVWQPFNEELAKNVLTKMKYPVIVVRNTEEEYLKAVVGLSNKLPFNPKAKYLLLFGNQRYVIAKKQEYTHIDSFIVDIGIEAPIVKYTYEREYGV
ncbi:hypothetical protein EBZ38_01555 [bacterium]|nr:hypothetical protein [bacterium]NDD82956.1 hypothetical protein [bacterium]